MNSINLVYNFKLFSFTVSLKLKKNHFGSQTIKTILLQKLNIFISTKKKEADIKFKKSLWHLTQITLIKINQFSSVQFSHSVMSDSLQPYELQHARPPRPSPTPGVHSNSRPSSPWCHSAISSSVVPFSSCPQSLPASESFPVSQLFAWGGQSTGISALASFLPKKSQGWSPSEWTGWISLQSKGLSRVFSNTTVQKYQFFGSQPSSQSNSHIIREPQIKITMRYHFTSTAATSLQLCPTLCDPIDGSPPGSPIPGILQARTLEWVAIFFSNA